MDKRIVRQETLANGYRVSTVWLGLDHQFGDGPPLIFETMVENPCGEWEDFQERYSTENDAILGHMRAVDQFKERVAIRMDDQGGGVVMDLSERRDG